MHPTSAAPRRPAGPCHKLQSKILTLPDFAEVYPTHLAESLCGVNTGSRLSTTIGYERRTNRVLCDLTSQDAGAKQCMDLTNLPAVPPSAIVI